MSEDVFSRPECVFNYCPHPDECQEQCQASDTPRLPADDLKVDFGVLKPGSSNPMPAEVRQAYEDRIEASARRGGVLHDRPVSQPDPDPERRWRITFISAVDPGGPKTEIVGPWALKEDVVPASDSLSAALDACPVLIGSEETREALLWALEPYAKVDPNTAPPFVRNLHAVLAALRPVEREPDV